MGEEGYHCFTETADSVVLKYRLNVEKHLPSPKAPIIQGVDKKIAESWKL